MPSALMRRVVTLVLAAAAAAAVASGAAADDSACTPDPVCTTESVPTDTTTTPPPPTTTEPTTTTDPTTPTATPTPTTTEPAPTETTSAWSVVEPKAKPATKAKEKEKAKEATAAAETVAAPTATLGPQFVTPALGGHYVFPVFGPASFTDTFGAARADVSWHHGDDIFAPLGSPILAVADGTLFSVGWNDIGGNRLWLRDARGNYFYYAHLAAFASGVADGVKVTRGQVIGFVGNTGDAAGTPYHLHFEIHPVGLLGFGYDGAVDPTTYLRSWQRASDPEGVAVAPAGRTAPPAGAVLLGASDIGNADGLEPGALTRVLNTETRLQVLPAIRKQAPPAAEPAHGGEGGEAAGAVARVRDFDGALPPGIADAGIWDRVATCESNRRWNTNTGNGFYGGLQFEAGTWLAYGGAAFAPSAHLATREQQIVVAKRVLAAQGWLAWPACSARLGLR